MPTIRVEKDADNPYVMINKIFLNDPRLSFKAKGILAYLLSKPDHWKTRAGDLANHATNGKGSIYSGLNELKKYGYATYKKEIGEDGQYTAGVWTIYETPHTGNPDVDNPEDSNNDCSKDKRESNDSQGDPNPPTKKKRSLSARDIIKRTLITYFAGKTGLSPPLKKTRAQCSAAAKLWWNPLCDIAGACDNDIECTKQLIDWAINRLDQQGMTMSHPLSIKNTAIAERARRKRGGDGRSAFGGTGERKASLATGMGPNIAELLGDTPGADP